MDDDDDDDYDDQPELNYQDDNGDDGNCDDPYDGRQQDLAQKMTMMNH